MHPAFVPFSSQPLPLVSLITATSPPTINPEYILVRFTHSLPGHLLCYARLSCTHLRTDFSVSTQLVPDHLSSSLPRQKLQPSVPDRKNCPSVSWFSSACGRVVFMSFCFAGRDHHSPCLCIDLLAALSSACSRLTVRLVLPGPSSRLPTYLLPDSFLL